MNLDNTGCPSGLCGCYDLDLVTSMLTYLSQTDCYFTDSQRGVADPSLNEKMKIAHETLHKSPQTFLTRYGEYLNNSHKQYFYKNFVQDTDLIYQLRLLDKDISSSQTRMKNRRFTAMKQLMKEGDYFSDEQMKHRDPLLYEQMIGQYLTDSEIQSQSDALLRNHCGLSSVLFEQMESKENEALYQRQLDKQQSQLEEDDSDEEEEEEEMEDTDEPPGPVKIDEGDKLALREEFLHIMQERFLAGSDMEFDYSAVDGCTDYDDLKQEGEDAEERYFNDDDDDEAVDGSRQQVSSLAPDEYDY